MRPFISFCFHIHYWFYFGAFYYIIFWSHYGCFYIFTAQKLTRIILQWHISKIKNYYVQGKGRNAKSNFCYNHRVSSFLLIFTQTPSPPVVLMVCFFKKNLVKVYWFENGYNYNVCKTVATPHIQKHLKSCFIIVLSHANILINWRYLISKHPVKYCSNILDDLLSIHICNYPSHIQYNCYIQLPTE